LAVNFSARKNPDFSKNRTLGKSLKKSGKSAKTGKKWENRGKNRQKFEKNGKIWKIGENR